MRHSIIPITALAACALAVFCSAPAVAATPETKPQVMLVATYHLANNNRDLINLTVEDITTEHRQAEIERLVGNLARWRPTKIVVEWPRADQAGLDDRYANYRDGTFEPTANERDQIGMRLARALGHDRVYAVDWNESAPGEWAEYDFMKWAADNGEGDRFAAFIERGQARLDRTADRMRNQSVIEWYRELNAPGQFLREQQPYFEIASFGSNENNPGAAWVGGWYARNLRIFNNLKDVIEPDDRVLVLYGVGHAYFLDQMLKDSGAATLIDPLPYIGS